MPPRKILTGNSSENLKMATEVKRPLPHPQLTQKKSIGGCSGTQFGCCPDNITPKRNPNGANCLLR